MPKNNSATQKQIRVMIIIFMIPVILWDIETNDDKMEIKISLGKNDELEIGFFDKGKPVDGAKVRHRNIDDVKPGGLGTFFIQQIMDAVVFREGEKPWINHLILTKKL